MRYQNVTVRLLMSGYIIEKYKIKSNKKYANCF